jgi:hypothetical protein
MPLLVLRVIVGREMLQPRPKGHCHCQSCTSALPSDRVLDQDLSQLEWKQWPSLYWVYVEFLANSSNCAAAFGKSDCRNAGFYGIALGIIDTILDAHRKWFGSTREKSSIEPLRVVRCVRQLGKHVESIVVLTTCCWRDNRVGS